MRLQPWLRRFARLCDGSGGGSLRARTAGGALRHGLWASLAPKPLPDQAGNGTRLHASLTSLATGQPAFADPAGRYGLSRTGYHFIGGLLAHLPALVALTCGSVNSYRRLAPGFWSSAFVAYGADNRAGRRSGSARRWPAAR
ncbi:MAG: hypothetical protein ACRDNZ_09285 [Streptosporangiaceae bacterium]